MQIEFESNKSLFGTLWISDEIYGKAKRLLTCRNEDGVKEAKRELINAADGADKHSLIVLRMLLITSFENSLIKAMTNASFDNADGLVHVIMKDIESIEAMGTESSDDTLTDIDLSAYLPLLEIFSTLELCRDKASYEDAISRIRALKKLDDPDYGWIRKSIVRQLKQTCLMNLTRGMISEIDPGGEFSDYLGLFRILKCYSVGDVIQFFKDLEYVEGKGYIANSDNS